MQYAGASPAGRGGGQSPYRKLIVKPPPAPKASTATIITARRTEYPPNSPHGRGQTENVQLGVRLRRGLANPRNLILDAWSSSCLQEAIRNARCAVPLSRLTHALTACSLRAPQLCQDRGLQLRQVADVGAVRHPGDRHLGDPRHRPHHLHARVPRPQGLPRHEGQADHPG